MSHLYDSFANLYDPLLGLPLRSLRNLILRELDVRQQPLIVDLCCGTGSQLKHLYRAGFRHLHGTDLSLAMLTVANRGNTRLHLSRQNATQTAFQNAIADTVILSLALHEKDPDARTAILREAHRILKSGGTLLVADYELTQDTGSISRLLIHAIERMAGTDHHRNFLSYLEAGGLPNLIDSSRFRLYVSHRLARRTLILNRYQKA